MGFKLGVRRNKDNAIKREMFYDPDSGLQLPSMEENAHPVLDNGEKAPSIDWYLKPLVGRDTMKIQDEMVDMNTKKGTAKMKTGTATQIRLMGSVVHVDGLEWENGTPIETITERAFAELLSWQINQVAEWIDEINKDSDAAKAEAKGE